METKTEFKFEVVKSEIMRRIQEALIEQEISPLVEFCKPLIESMETDADIKSIVDTTFREILHDYVTEEECMFENYEPLLNLSIFAARNEISSGNLPVMLLSDLFDCQTLDDCEVLFELVESRVDVWKDDVFFKNVKNQLLRSCNDLLRRLSRSQNTVFCGRILVFLARFFPLFERSGLNLISEFNHENATTFSLQEEGVLSETIMSGGDSVAGDETDSVVAKETEDEPRIQVDYNLYRKFWQLQEYFRQPAVCYNRSSWKQFQSFSGDVLSAFQSFKLDPTTTGSNNLHGLDAESSSASVDSNKNKDQDYFAKYLTNQKLLELQLSDSNFRRYILIQFLILFQYLKSNVRFKQDAQVLSEEQNNWVKETVDKIYKLIEETPPNGREMRKCVEHMLKREEYWNSWKNDGCPDLKEVNESCNIKSTYTKKRRLGEELRSAEASGKTLIGNEELNRLWNFPDNWEACKSKKRVFTPNIEKYFDTALHAKEEQRATIVTNSDFSWRALRLLSQKSPHYFTPSNKMVMPVNQYLESVVEKLSKDFAVGSTKTATENIAIDDTEDISEDDELLKNEECNTVNEDGTPRANQMDVGNETPNGAAGLVNLTIINDLAEKLKDQWKAVAPHLKFTTDEIQYFGTETDNVIDQAKKVLTVWMEQQEPEEATIANLQAAINKASIPVTI